MHNGLIKLTLTVRLATTLIASAILSGNLWAASGWEEVRLFDLAKGEDVPLSRAIYEIGGKNLILVGEQHAQENSHVAQLLIIKALRETGVPVAIGLEMFSTNSQKALDQWVKGDMGEADFQKIYYENWSFPWPLYSMIFNYARDMKIPLVGLNVPRPITQQVAREGFESLKEEQKRQLPVVECSVDADYMTFIKRAHESHAHSQFDFTYFCEAQLLWDEVMAVHALKYLEANARFSMVLLTGTAHAWKMGIPAQIRKRSGLSYVVILPQVPRDIEKGNIIQQDADYLILALPK